MDELDIQTWSAEVARAEGVRLGGELRRGLLAGQGQATLLALAGRRLARLTPEQRVWAVAGIGCEPDADAAPTGSTAPPSV